MDDEGYGGYGGGGAAPGGYMASPGDSAGGGGGGGGRGGRGRAPAPQKTLIPMTCSTLTRLKPSAAADSFCLPDKGPEGGEVEVMSVRVAGRVLAIVDELSHCEITISDSTGRVELIVYTDEEDTYWPSIRPLIRVHSLVEAVATVKKGQDDFVGRLVASSIKPIKDSNAFTAHMLACMHTYLMVTKGPLPPPGGHAPAVATTGGFGASATWGGAASGAAVAATGGRFADPNVEAVSRAFDACKDSGATEEGTAVAEIVAVLKRNSHSSGRPPLTEKDVRDAIATLTMEGFLYSTVDEDHYRSTTS